MVRVAITFVLLLALPSVACAQARIALLIGNQSYDRSVGVLKNPHNDIAVVGDALRAQGFEILPPIKDARRSAILGGVRELVRRLNSAGSGAVGFVYYSGHGAAEKDTNINYLIPVDAKEPGSSAFWDESLKLDDVLRLLDGARSAAKFVVFDACRNELQLPTKDTTKGLVPVAEQQGMFIAYASAPGRTASDRGVKSGPYAAALAAEFSKPGLDHLNLFQNVKEAVLASTGGTQQPWESNGLGRRVYLTGQPKPAASLEVSDAAREWSRVDKNSMAELETFLSRHGKSAEADYAKARLDNLKRQPSPSARPASPSQTAAAAPVAPPRSFQSREIKWRLASSFPKSVHDSGPDPEPMISSLQKLSQGAIALQMFAAGEIVPALQVMDAVLAGAVDLGWTPAGYYIGKDVAFAIASGAVPFGLTPEKLIVWAEGPGKSLREQLYGKHGLKALPCSMIGSTGIYSRKELKTPEDLKSYKMRVSGLAAEVLVKVGGAPQQIAGGDIYPALEKGTLDGGIFAGPIMDERLGFVKVAKYYYIQAWPQPAYLIDLIMKTDKWQSLEPGERQLFELACDRNLPASMVLIGSKEMDAVRRMAAQGAIVQYVPSAVTEPLRKAANEVLEAYSGKSPEFAALRASIAGTR